MSKTGTVEKDIKLKNPFPGLRPFTFEESNLYFGRSKQSRSVTKILKANRFAAVIGASGSGKSSLAYCGVAPEYLKDAGSSGSMISFRPGNEPVRNMVDAFAKAFPGKVTMVDDITLLRENKSLEDWIGEQEFRDHHFLMVIDQFEELFRYRKIAGDEENGSRVQRFIDLIVEAVRSSNNRIVVMITMRSDFVGECSAYQQLTELINKSNYLVPQMTRDDYRDVIIGPLSLTGVKIEESLVEQLLDEVGADSDQLPVLQHAMMRTFNYWKQHNKPDKPIISGDYEAIGTMKRALSDHANEAYDELTEEQRMICERLFKTVTEKSGDNRGVRRPTTIQKIADIAGCGAAEVIEIADRFRTGDRTFVTPYQPIRLSPASIVDVSHESLMRIWGRLRLWVDEEAASVQMYKRLIDASALYQAGRTGLWRPPDLQLALNWREKQKPALEWALQYYPAYERSMLYLSTSDREFRKEEENKIKLQKRRLRVSRIFALILGGIAILAMGLFLWTRDLNRQMKLARDEAEANAERARRQSQIADSARIEAEASEAEALKQQRIAIEQTSIATEQTEAARQNLQEANRQTRLADLNYREAQRQQQMATRNEQAAVEQKEQAEIAREEAYQRRLLSIAKSISVKLLQINDDPDLQALLAYQAYKFNTENKGSPYDADIYGGLYRALKSNISSSYNVYSGHNESAVKAMAWLKSRKGFLSADSKGRILFMSGDYNNNRSYSEIARAGQAIEALVISPDESVFACGTSGRGIFIYRLANPDDFYRLEAHNGNVNMLAFNSSGSRLVSGGMDNTIMVWDLSTRTGQQFAVLSARPSSLAVSNFSNLVVVGSRDGKLYEYDLDNPGEGRLIYNNSGNPVMAVTYSPDDRAVVIGTLNGMVRIINRSGSSTGITLRGPEARVTDMAFSYNGKFMAASSNDGNVYLWQTSDWQNEPVIVTDNGGFVLTLCFSDDSRYFYSGSTEFPRLIGRPVEASLMVDDFCRLVDRNLSQAEWDLYIAEDIPYEMTCPR